MPPESSQDRRPAFECLWLFFMDSLAASIHARGMPESGTGTAIHSERGLGVYEVCLLYSLPFSPATDTCLAFAFVRLYHQMPYSFEGSRRVATPGASHSA